MKKYSKLPMTYEQLKQSHDEWKQLAQQNFTFYKHEKVRADVAEGREQRLKEVIKDTITEFELCADPKNGLEVVINCLKDLLSTLYPDTPAPKEGE